MAVPKKRTASSKRDMRRSHHAKTRQRLQPCPRCKQLVPAHMACPNCGTYKGREVIDVTAALDRAERKYREKTKHQH